MYGVFALVSVKDVARNRRILLDWGGPDETPTTVEWIFTSLSDDTTFVGIANTGFAGDRDAIVAQAIDAMGGFSLVLAGAKAYLEHGIELNLVADRFPPGLADKEQ